MDYKPIIVGVILLVLFILASRSQASRDDHGNYILNYPWPMKTIGAIFLFLGVVGTFFILKVEPPVPSENYNEKVILGLTCFFFFVLLPLLLCLEFFLVKYLVNNEKIVSNTPWSRKKTLYWKDINFLSYSPNLKWFVIRNNKSETVRVGGMVAGINVLLEAMENNTPSYIYEKLQEKM